MGTVITLSLGGIDIDWAKNHRGTDHGSLFQPADRRTAPSDQIDYDYFKESGEDPSEMERAFVRPLKSVVPRLELLGFTIDAVGKMYDGWVLTWREEHQPIVEASEAAEIDPLTFDEFAAFVTQFAVVDLDNEYIKHEDPHRLRRTVGRFAKLRKTIKRIPKAYDHDDTAYSERSYFGSLIQILPPYALLRLLAENAVNLETDIVWQYGPLVEGGYAAESEFNPSARRTETFLIATEGSSDAHILKHAFALLRPEVADFFRFIDVSERHPFPGTGNLVKFAEGLAKIDVQNQIVFVFDNDAEGADAFGKLGSLTLPLNMRALLLPAVDAFRAFPAKGPEGDRVADINGRAAAIECYLDHRVKGFPPARIIWTNYKKEMDTYQGSLEHKETYTKEFLKLTTTKLLKTGYDVSRLQLVLNALIAECTAITFLALCSEI